MAVDLHLPYCFLKEVIRFSKPPAICDYTRFATALLTALGVHFFNLFFKFNKYKMVICYCTLNASAREKCFTNDFLT